MSFKSNQINLSPKLGGFMEGMNQIPEELDQEFYNTERGTISNQDRDLTMEGEPSLMGNAKKKKEQFYQPPVDGDVSDQDDQSMKEV